MLRPLTGVTLVLLSVMATFAVDSAASLEAHVDTLIK